MSLPDKDQIYCRLKPIADWSQSYRLIVVATAVLGCLLNAGMAFGFSAIFPVLLEIQAFHDLCPEGSTSPCRAQTQALLGMFTVATSLLNVAALPTGAILDSWGPRITATAVALLTSLGCFLFGNGGDGWEGHLRYYVGFLLLAVAGPAIMNSSLSFSNLFPNRKGLICAMLVGCFDASSAVFVFLAHLVRSGVTFSAALSGYAAVPLVTASAAWAFWPSTPVATPVLAQETCDAAECTADAAPSWWKGPHLQHLPVRQQLLSREFWLVVQTTSITMVCINFFIATAFAQLSEVNEESALKLTQTFAIMLPVGGLVYTPVIGPLVDTIGPTLGFAVLWCLYLTFQLLLRLYVETEIAAAAYLAFAVFALVRPLFYTLGASFVGQVFGFGTFGKVYGLLTTFAGIACLIVQPLGNLAANNGFEVANGVLTVAQATTAALPLCILVLWRRPDSQETDALLEGFGTPNSNEGAVVTR
eukprot:CAMPEP_0206433732 /NCGR_PEP_ID=MMETSP0324_2-20121206/8700_1 /ASSEMBLY_ACC=CAM_ASM_000836 /TAXON_ID=2866 /ORGANISM="Crypthecodinium cohnii, Strain Seligo" /LENGTH=473 /DNA_ID=CAMNT_0053900037 /DNA_START=87 /DNA_END=1505 /DNA_ORIENTATION=-